MANPEHVKILKQGVKFWNYWRTANPAVSPDLHGAHLVGADLRGVNITGLELTTGLELAKADPPWAKLSGANLSHANLSHANLTEAHLRGADLTGANLSEAHLTQTDLFGAFLTDANLSKADLFWVDLVGAFLTGADLSEAHLTGADLSGADLSGTDLSNAFVRHTTFANVDLSTAKGLDTIIHRGPSTIGIDTVYQSQGKIPEIFLRGAGVGDEFIALIKSLAGAIQFYSCFISYSSKDQEFAERLYADLQAKGVRCWFAPKDLKIGDKFRQRIDEEIRFHDKLLVVLSAASVNSSWVEKEVLTAFEKEKDQEGKPVLFPIRLDEVVMKAGQEWAGDIRRTRHIGDFTKWQDHNFYQRAFQRLLRDLKGETSTQATVT